MWFWPYKGNNNFLDETHIHSKTFFYAILIQNLHVAGSGLVAPKCNIFVDLIFVLSLTKEADRTNLKSKLLVLITKVIDHHINYRYLVYFGCVDFNHGLSIALSWLLKKKKSANGYMGRVTWLHIRGVSMCCRSSYSTSVVWH